MSSKEFLAEYRAEMKEWEKLTMEQRTLIIAFSWCVGLRLDGKDPAAVIDGIFNPKPEPDWRAD